MKKIGLFLDEINDQNIDISEKFEKLGHNTGNMLFWESLKNNIALEIKSPWYLKNIEQLKLEEYKAFITTDLIWIRHMVDFGYLNQVLDSIGDLPLIPISIGLQANDFALDFKLHPNTVKILQRISERCVMGVRGYYTAEILSKHGISNFEVIGCPSMYMKTPGFETINTKQKVPNKVTVNFETFYAKLSKSKTEFLKYSAEHNFDFVEQARGKLCEKNISDATVLSEIDGWLNSKLHCFYDINEWRDYIRAFDFSMGMRFHGNVIALWEGISSLFLICDSRTKELCELYSLPTMNVEDFDISKEPEFYYKKADYSTFHIKYPELKNKWLDFLRKNDLI